MYRKQSTDRWIPAAVFLGTGLILLGLRTLDILPLAAMARKMAPDSELSETFRLLLARSQLVLAYALLFVAALFATAGIVLRRFERGVFRSHPRRFGLGILLVVFLSSLTLQFVLFDDIPHVTDAISHSFQAKILEQGRLSAPLPPCPEAFFQQHVIMTRDGRWFSKYTPGHPLVLAAGRRLGMPWLPVPLCSGLAAVALYCIGRRLFNERVARSAALFFAVSPLALLLAGSYMSHTPFLMFILAGTTLAAAGLDPRTSNLRARTALGAAGFCLGMAALTRPQDFAIFVPVLGVGLLYALVKHRRPAGSSAAWVGAGLLIPAAILLFWNTKLYGRPLVIGYGFTEAQTILPVFQSRYGINEAFGVRQAIRLTLNTLYRFDQVALGWPVTLPWVVLALGAARFRRSVGLAWLGIAGGLTVYFFYDYYGLEFEARYYFNLLPFVLLLLAAGLPVARRLLSVAAGRWTGQPGSRRLASRLLMGLLLAFFLHGLAYYWRDFLWPRYSSDYEQAGTRLQLLAGHAGLRDALVLVPCDDDNEMRYSSGFLHNDPLLTHAVIYARDRAGHYDCLRAAFPDRTLYRFIPNAEWTDGRFEPLFPQ
jgi:xanthosine utilization system XapX-like protein